MIRVVFLGTPDFAVPTLERLIEDDRFEVVGVLSQPDRRAGRGQRLMSPPVKDIATAAGIPVLQPCRIRGNPEAADFQAQLNPDLGVVVAFGQILPAEFFTLPRLGTLNLHASLLPRYRGAAPIVHALLDGEPETGVTIMQIEEGLDSGPTLASLRIPILDSDTAGTLAEKLSRQGALLMADTAAEWVAGRIEAKPQNLALSTYAPKISRAEAEIDWERAAAEIWNQVRAFNPVPGAWTTFRGETLKIWAARRVERTSQDIRPGEIDLAGERILIQCGEDAIEPLVLQPANRKRMRSGDFVHGFRLTRGEAWS